VHLDDIQHRWKLIPESTDKEPCEATDENSGISIYYIADKKIQDVAYI
jgi:hypothetical protein